MVIKIDGEGYLLDGDGKRETDDKGNPVKPFTQAALDNVIGSRIKTTKEQLEQANREKIAALEQQIIDAKKGAASPEEVARLNTRLHELEQQVLTADEIANKRANDARREAEQDRDTWKQAATKYKSDLEQTLVRNEIIAEANNRRNGVFNDPNDLVDSLSKFAVIEEEADDKGRKTGAIRVRYKMMVPKEDGKGEEEKILTVEDAANVIRDKKPYFLRGSNTGGPGHRYSVDDLPRGGDLSKLSPAEKIAAGYRDNARNRQR